MRNKWLELAAISLGVACLLQAATPAGGKERLRRLIHLPHGVGGHRRQFRLCPRLRNDVAANRCQPGDREDHENTCGKWDGRTPAFQARPPSRGSGRQKPSRPGAGPRNRALIPPARRRAVRQRQTPGGLWRGSERRRQERRSRESPPSRDQGVPARVDLPGGARTIPLGRCHHRPASAEAANQTACFPG